MCVCGGGGGDSILTTVIVVYKELTTGVGFEFPTYSMVHEMFVENWPTVFICMHALLHQNILIYVVYTGSGGWYCLLTRKQTVRGSFACSCETDSSG